MVLVYIGYEFLCIYISFGRVSIVFFVKYICLIVCNLNFVLNFVF